MSGTSRAAAGAVLGEPQRIGVVRAAFAAQVGDGLADRDLRRRSLPAEGDVEVVDDDLLAEPLFEALREDPRTVEQTNADDRIRDEVERTGGIWAQLPPEQRAQVLARLRDKKSRAVVLDDETRDAFRYPR